MTDREKCLKCGGAMIEGFILDRTYGDKKQQAWIEGAPESSFWSGLKTSDRAVYNVRAMRCADCGFLDFYADQGSDLGGGFSELFSG